MRVETQHDLAQEEVRNIEMPIEFLRPRTQGDSEKGILVLAHSAFVSCHFWNKEPKSIAAWCFFTCRSEANRSHSPLALWVAT